MKTLYSCLFILTFFISCDGESELSTNKDSQNGIVERITTELPGNADNPYDETGWVHNEIFSSYYESENKPSTIQGIIGKVEDLTAANINFKVLKTSSYQPVSATRVQYLLDHQSTCVGDVISKSSLSSEAKQSLSTFVNSFIPFFETETDCVVLYNYVVAYEHAVNTATGLTARDKQIILTTTSVARHSAYLARKKPKRNTDPDWTILVGNVIAAAEGADLGMAEAITEGLVTGIAQN